MALTLGAPLESLSPGQVTELQQLLIELGYNPGPVDGIIGPQTKGAYARFLGANGGGDPNVVGSYITSMSDRDPNVTGTLVRGSEMNAAPAAQPQAQPVPTAAAPVAEPSAVPAPAAPTVAPADVNAEVLKRYPQWTAYLNHAEIGPVLQMAAEKGWGESELQGALFNTNWWQTTAQAIRTWDALAITDPASAMAKVKAKGIEVANAAAKLGLNFSQQDSDWVGSQILREGWTQDQLNRWFGAVLRNEGNAVKAGDIRADMSRVKGLAGQYMVNIGDDEAREYAIKMMEGTTSEQAVTATFRELAMGRFYWLQDQISRGITPQLLFEPIRREVAGLLEVNADEVNFNNPKWSALTSPQTDGKTARSMNFHEAQIWARSQPEWRDTANAKSQANATVEGLLKSLGAIA